MSSRRHLVPTIGIPPSRRHRRAVGLWLSVLVLLWAQGMGLWHRLAHDDPHAAAAVSARVATAEPAAQAFGHLAGDEQACQAYDHLALADLLLATPVVLAVMVVPAPTASPLAVGVARARPRHYSARAPPLA